MGFPKRLIPSDTISQKRKERISAIFRVTSAAICVRLLIVCIEISAYFYFSSRALLLDGLATLVDVVSSIVLMTSIWFASKPPDTNHPFGHGRIEPICGFQLGIFLLFSGAVLLFQEVWLILHPIDNQIEQSAWIIPLIVVILLELTYRLLRRVAIKTNSAALLAEALHMRTDSMNSFIAFCSLILAAGFSNFSSLFDHLGAAFIALLMIILGVQAARENFHQLVDRVPDANAFDIVRRAAMTCSHVKEVEKVRIQQYGPDAHIDIDIEVDPVMCVEEAHKVSQHVRLAICEAWPQVREVVVHIEPYYPSDH